MIKHLLYTVFLFATIKAVAQKENYSSFIPKDYDTLYDGFAKGDLNKDGIDDVVLALGHKAENNETKNIYEDSIPPRLLVVLFGTNNGFIKSDETSTAILCKNCGGIFGDPFAGVMIEKNMLVITHYGGSAWRWSITDKFRFQNNGLYLIRERKISYWNVKNCDKLNDFAGTDYEDVNFITGEFEIKKISENCKLLANKKGKKAISPLSL